MTDMDSNEDNTSFLQQLLEKGSEIGLCDWGRTVLSYIMQHVLNAVRENAL